VRASDVAVLADLRLAADPSGAALARWDLSANPVPCSRSWSGVTCAGGHGGVLAVRAACGRGGAMQRQGEEPGREASGEGAPQHAVEMGESRGRGERGWELGEREERREGG